MENDSNYVENFRSDSETSDFPFKGKLKPADKFKIKLMNKMNINNDSKLIETRPLVNIEKPTLKNIESSLRDKKLILNNQSPDDLNDQNIRIRNDLNVLDRNDFSILETFNKDEILFKKIPFAVRNDIANKYKEFCDVFDETFVAPVKRGNNSDILGKRLQQEAIILENMVGTITQAVNNDYGNKELFKDIGDDLLLVAAGLGTEGSMIRINNRDPAAGRLLRMKMKKTIFNDVIKNEIKDAESNFPLKRNNFFNGTRSSMPAYKNNYYIDKTKAQNAFRSEFNINPNKGQFFREGAANRQAVPSETLTSRLSGKQEEDSEARAPSNEGVINGSGSERPPQNILSEGGRLGKYLWCWKKICGLSYVGLLQIIQTNKKSSIIGRVTKNGTSIMELPRCKQNTTR
jgi:hypothetical protein